ARPTLPSRAALAFDAKTLHPPDRRAERHPKTRRRLTHTRSRQPGFDHPVSQVLTIGSCHISYTPPIDGHSHRRLMWESRDSIGIPPDSNFPENALVASGGEIVLSTEMKKAPRAHRHVLGRAVISNAPQMGPGSGRKRDLDR